MDLLPFHEKLLLSIVPIVVTALLGGLLVPWILGLIASRKAEAAKLFEAAIARQTKVIDAQAGLLDDLTNALWNWRYLLMRVTYAGAEQSDEALETAWKAYDQRMWDSLHAIRVQTTRSRRLVSQGAFDRLSREYADIVKIDQRLCAAMKLDGDVRRRDLEELNYDVFNNVSNSIDAALYMLAGEVRLTSAESTQ